MHVSARALAPLASRAWGWAGVGRGRGSISHSVDVHICAKHMSVTAFTVCGKHSKTPHCTQRTAVCTPQRAKLSDSGPRGAGGRAPGRCGPARRGAPGQAGGPPETAADAERAAEAQATARQSLVSTKRYVPTHDTPLRQSIFCAHTQCLTHGRCVRPSYGLTSTSTGDHRNILAHSNDGAPLPQTPPPIVSSAASSRPRLWVVEGGDGMNARRGRMRAGLLRRGAGQGRGRMSAWRLAGRQMGFCRLPPKSPRCGSVSERY